MKSRATCDSPVLPRSFTDVPAPSGQRRCRLHPEHCYRLQADAIRGCEPRSDRTMCRRCTHTPLGSGAPGQRPSSQRCADTFHVPTRSDPQLASSPAGTNKPAEAALCPESRARISWRHPKYAGFGDSVRSAQQVNIKMDWGGRMRRIGAPCTAVRVCVCVCVSVCACVCVSVRMCACVLNRRESCAACSEHP